MAYVRLATPARTEPVEADADGGSDPQHGWSPNLNTPCTYRERGYRPVSSTEVWAVSHLISLTYLSTATVPLEQGELLALLEHSRVRNRTAGLTGMLLYADGHFIQTLEGPAVAVDAAYGRIERDGRHRDVIVALRDEVTARRFDGWSMGFDGLDATTASRMPGFNAFLDATPYAGRSDEAMGRAGIFHRVFRDRMR